MTGLTRKPRRHRVRDTVRDTEQGETPWEDRGSESDRNTNGKPGETEVPSERVGDGETDSRRAVARAESSKAWPRGGTGADPEKQRTLAPGRWVRRQSHAATAPTGEPRRRAGSGRGGCSGVAGAGRRPPVKTGYRVWDTGCGRPQTESPGPESRGPERESRYDGGAHPGRSREQRPAFGPHRAPHLLAVLPPAMKPHPGSAPPARNDGHSGRGRGDRPALPPPPRARRPRGCSRRTWDSGPSAALRASRTRRAGPGWPLYMRACGIRGRRRGPCPPHNPACALPSLQPRSAFTLTSWPSSPQLDPPKPASSKRIGDPEHLGIRSGAVRGEASGLRLPAQGGGELPFASPV